MLWDILNIIGSLPNQHIILGLSSTIICIVGTWIYGRVGEKCKDRILIFVKYTIILNEVFFQLLVIYDGIWSVRTSLPLEMCYISALLIPIYKRGSESRLLKSWFFFAGFGGSLFAFINTNLSSMEFLYVSIHYFIAHGMVIFLMLTIIIDGFRPRWEDYFNAIKYTTVLVVLIIIINNFLDSNYMFTFEKPKGVNFTILMPEWPWYFLIMLGIGLVFYTLMMFVKIIPTQKKRP